MSSIILNLISPALWSMRHMKATLFPCLCPLHSVDCLVINCGPTRTWVGRRHACNTEQALFATIKVLVK